MRRGSDLASWLGGGVGDHITTRKRLGAVCGTKYTVHRNNLATAQIRRNILNGPRRSTARVIFKRPLLDGQADGSEIIDAALPLSSRPPHFPPLLYGLWFGGFRDTPFSDALL